MPIECTVEGLENYIKSLPQGDPKIKVVKALIKLLKESP